MTKIKNMFSGVLAKVLMCVALLGAFMLTMFALPASAATPNFGQTTQVQVMPFHISGQYTATTTAAVRFQIPYGAKLVGVSASARASGGTSPTLTVDVKSGGTTVLTAPLAVTAGAVSEASIAGSGNLADESVITVDLTIGGTSPTWNDIVVFLTLVRR